jgi:hydrogenase/urease accessory protein HupE
MMQRTLIGFILLFLTQLSFADEIRPGYLELKENSKDIFSVIWKVPAKGDKKLGLQAHLPTNCIDSVKPKVQLINAAYIQRWVVACEGGLFEESISIAGLGSTQTNVLLHLEFMNNTSQSIQLTPTNTSYQIPAVASSLQVAATYTLLGAEHILFGVDHLLFVFALLLIVSSTRRLLITITAFTLAHSITLISATLGFVQVPQQPVEAVIALSILFLAMEIVNGRRGSPGYASRWPWLVAFIFGLLHGFGFAGALAEVGLPQQAIPLALVFFNAGVELGQLLFVLCVVTLSWLLHKLKQPKLLSQAETVVLYSIGGLSTFWLFERLGSF